MRSALFAAAVALLYIAGVHAGIDISNALFRPNHRADEELIHHAQRAPPQLITQDTGGSTQVEIDLCNPENFEELFRELTYSPDRYTRYKGLDHTALFASSVTLSDKYAVIGSNGYDVFKGIVHVYVPKTVSKWSLQALIRSPVWDNGNFGNDVSIDGERIVVSANAYEKYDGIVFVYEHNLMHQCWLLTGTIYSPLASGPNRTFSQGFGYRVDMSGNFLIASTSVNNAYIFKEVNPGNWTLHTDLQPPAKDIFFGRAVAIENDLALVGAYGYERNVGRVFVYKYRPQNDSWLLFDQLSPLRSQSNFGYSVDLYNTSIIVGANGYYKYQFENKQEFDARLTQPAVNYGWAYVFQLAANGSKFYLEQEIPSPVGNNSYFGSGVGIYGDSIIVGADGYPCFGLTGAGFVFNRGADGVWRLNQSYPSPAGHEGHFGYAVDINANYSAIGAYGFDDLRGSIYLADRTPPEVPPPIIPVVPTMAPTQGGGESLSGGELDKKYGDSQLSLGVILALALAVLVVAGAAGLIIYCCCCMIPILPVLKKKKKKEEEDDSPYTVHSYAGYVEDEFYVPPAPVVLVDEDLKKDLKKEKSVKFMENGELRKMFPYKVYGPRGYTEEDNDTVPEELLEKKKVAADAEVHRQAAETRYEEEQPVKGLPLPEPQVGRHESFHSRQSYESRHSEQQYQYEQRYRHTSTTSMVEQAQRSYYESNYSMPTSGTPSEAGDTYHSMSSLTSQSHHVPPQYSAYARMASKSSRHSEEGEEEGDDHTVMSGTTEITSKSDGSLVNAAKERYRQQFQQAQQRQQFAHTSTTTTFQQQVVTSSSMVQTIKQEYASSQGFSQQDDASVVSGSTQSSSSANSFVAAAKEKYARLQQQQGASRVASTAASSEHGSSFMERLKSRGAAFSETGTSVTGTQDKASHVEAARNRYASLMRTGTGIASASADHDGDDGVSVATRSTVHSAGSAGSGGSVVDAMRAKYAQIRAASASQDNSSSSEPASLVQQVKAKYRASLRSDGSSGAGEQQHGDDDNSTVVTHSTHSTTSSQVEQARAKYARLRERREQSLASDSASVHSGSTASSLVEAARARGEALKRAAQLPPPPYESDMQSESQQSASVSQQYASDSADQSSYMVSAIKVRYQASSHYSSSATTTTNYSHSATSTSESHSGHEGATESRTSGIAAMTEEASQSPSQKSSTGSASVASSVDSARSAAMNKFAFYKAKAEAEARARGFEDVHESSSANTGVAVHLKDSVFPARRRGSMESEATGVTGVTGVTGDTKATSETSGGVSAFMRMGDEHSTVAGSAVGEGSSASPATAAEELKARAMAKAREKYARAKELAEQEKANAAQAVTALGSAKEDEERNRVVEEARRRMQQSLSIPDAPATAMPPPPPYGAHTTVSTSRSSTTTRTVTQSAAHSLDVDASSSVAREVTRTSAPSSRQGGPPSAP